MSARPRLERNAGTRRLIDWTGERCVPWGVEASLVYEHFHRYMWAARFLEGRRVLDLGSGEGFGAAILASVAREVVGADIDAAAVEHARLRYGRPGLSYETASALDLSRFERGSFDAVVAFEMIEHVAGPRAAARGDRGRARRGRPAARLHA